jgi:hypothetical protein
MWVGSGSHIASGNVELAARHWPKAERAYRRALELDPYNGTAQHNLVLAQQAAMKMAPALSTAHGRVRFDPGDDASRRQLDGVVYSTLVNLQWLVALLAFVVLLLRVSNAACRLDRRSSGACRLVDLLSAFQSIGGAGTALAVRQAVAARE